MFLSRINSFLFRINNYLPCRDLNPGPPSTKQIAYQYATVLWYKRLVSLKPQCVLPEKVSYPLAIPSLDNQLFINHCFNNILKFSKRWMPETNLLGDIRGPTVLHVDNCWLSRSGRAGLSHWLSKVTFVTSIMYSVFTGWTYACLSPWLSKVTIVTSPATCL